jgi:hypothetical protein
MKRKLFFPPSRATEQDISSSIDFSDPLGLDKFLIDIDHPLGLKKFLKEMHNPLALDRFLEKVLDSSLGLDRKLAEKIFDVKSIRNNSSALDKSLKEILTEIRLKKEKAELRFFEKAEKAKLRAIEKSAKALLSAIVEKDFFAARHQVLFLKENDCKAEDITGRLLRLIHKEAINKALSEKNNETKPSALSAQVSHEQWQLYHEILISGQRHWDCSPDRFLALDMLLLRMMYSLPQTDMELKLRMNDSSNPNNTSITNEGRASAIDIEDVDAIHTKQRTSF